MSSATTQRDLVPYLGSLLKWCVSLGLIALLLYRTPISQIATGLAELDLSKATAAFALTCIGWWVSALRLYFIAPEFRLGVVIRMTLVGLYYGTVLPGQLTGDLVKAYRLSSTQSLPGRAAAVVLVDRVIALGVLLALGGLAAAYVSELPALFTPLLAGGAGVITFAIVLATSRVWTTLLGRLSLSPKLGRIGVLAGRLAIGLRSVTQHPYGIAANCIAALGFHMLCVGTHLVIAHALGINLPVLAWVTVYASVSILLVLPISIAGIGLREGGYVGMLSLFGVPPFLALSLSLVLLGFSLLGALAGAIAELGARRATLLRG